MASCRPIAHAVLQMVDEVPSPEPGLEDAGKRDAKAQFEDRNAARLDELEDRHHAVKLLIVEHWGGILLMFLYCFAGIFAVSLVTLFWHFITPDNPLGRACITRSDTAWIGYAWHGCLHWLTDAQLHKIQSILFSGGLGAFLTGVGQRYFGITTPKSENH